VTEGWYSALILVPVTWRAQTEVWIRGETSFNPRFKNGLDCAMLAALLSADREHRLLDSCPGTQPRSVIKKGELQMGKGNNSQKNDKKNKKPKKDSKKPQGKVTGKS
jgi:hypothetical protein